MAPETPPGAEPLGGSAGMAAGRGALLLAVAVVIGIVLLNAADSTPSPQQVVANHSEETTVTTSPGLSTTSLPARAPKDVKVIAANGTRVKGAGAKVTDTLRQAGYDVLSPTDAPKANASMAYFVTGYDRDAAEVARALGLSPTAVAPMPAPPPIGDARGAHVVVIIGPDLAGGTGDTTATTRGATATTRGATSTTRKTTTTTAKAGTTTTPKSNTTTTRKATTTTDGPG